MGSIDLWSLDVEGAELEVLRTVDFSRLQVSAQGLRSSHHGWALGAGQGTARADPPCWMACNSGQQAASPCGMVCDPLACSDRCMN